MELVEQQLLLQSQVILKNESRITNYIINDYFNPAQENTSVVVEVRIRPPYAQWRYRLDVIVDQRYVYFDTFSRHVQNFKGI